LYSLLVLKVFRTIVSKWGPNDSLRNIKVHTLLIIPYFFFSLSTSLITTVQIRQPVTLMVSTNAGVKNSDQCLHSCCWIRSRGHCLLRRLVGLCGRLGAVRSWTNGLGCGLSLLWNLL
jgi:hypothetical protein